MESSGLVACLNNGHGFDIVPAFSLPGMMGRMDEEIGSSRSVGLSAAFGPCERRDHEAGLLLSRREKLRGREWRWIS